MHARSAYSSRPLIVVGKPPNRVLYVANRFVLEFSDDGGLTWATVPGTENGLDSDMSQQRQFYDHDYPIYFKRMYRSYGLGEYADTSPAILHTEPTDYRVIYLTYSIVDFPSQRKLVENLEPHSVELHEWSCSISGRTLNATPSHVYHDVRHARTDFEHVAEAWQLETEALSEVSFGLQFQRAHCEGTPSGALWEIVRTPPGQPIAKAMDFSQAERLPLPSNSPFVLNEFVVQVRERLRRGFLQRQPIATLAYWLRDLLEAHFGARQAIVALNISENVWREVGRLCAKHDWREGRKALSSWNEESLDWREVLFLKISAGHFLHRLAIAESGNVPTRQLNMEIINNAIADALGQELNAPTSAADSAVGT